MSDQEPGPKSSGWRWLVGAIVVFVLVYPLARWMRGGGGEAATRQATSQSALQRSLEYYQAGRYQDAVDSARSAVAADPNSVEAYNNLAVSYLQLHKYDDGIRAAQEALRIRPDYQLAKNNLAWIQREQARAAGPPAQAQPPGSAGALLNESMQHAQAGRFKECMDTAMQSAKLNPSSSQAFNNAGFCASKLKLWDEAIGNLQEAVRLSPDSQLAKNNLTAVKREKLAAEGPTAQ